MVRKERHQHIIAVSLREATLSEGWQIRNYAVVGVN